MIDNLGTATSELQERLGVDRVDILPVVYIPCFGVRVVIANLVHAAQHFGILRFKDEAWVVRIASIQIAIPGAKVPVIPLPPSGRDLKPGGAGFRDIVQPLAVAGVLRHIPDLRSVVWLHRAIGSPACISVAIGHTPFAIFLASQL